MSTTPAPRGGVPDAPSFAKETEAFVHLLCDQGLLAPMS